MNLKKYCSTRTIVSLVLFTILFSVYFYSAARTNPGYADSDEIITMGHLLSLPHPSGYPLSVLLTKIFTLLPIPGSIAFKANLLNGFLHSLTIVVLFLLTSEILNNIKKTDKNQKENYYLILLTSALGSLFLAFSAIFWLYSAVAEVAPLNDLFALLSVYFGYRWRIAFLQNQKDQKKWLLSTSIAVGLGLSHLHSFLLVLPGLGLMFILTTLEKKQFQNYLGKNILPILGSIAIGFLLPTLLIIWYSARKADYNWYIPLNFQGIFEHITRKAYSGFFIENNTKGDNYIGKIDLNQYLKTFPMYWQFLFDHFTAVGLVLGFAGIIWLFLKNRKLFYSFITLFLFTGLLFALRIGIPAEPSKNLEYRSSIGIIHRQYLIGDTMWGIFIVFGLWWLFQLIVVITKKQILKTLILTSLLTLVALSYVVYDNYKVGIQRNNTIAYDYAKTVLSQADKDAVIICIADFSCFSIAYLQEVEGYRKDVVLLPKNNSLKYNFLSRNPQYRGYESYNDNPYYFADLLSWNVSKRPTYLTELTVFYIDYVGLDGNPFYVIPEGYLFRVTTKIPQTFTQPDYLVSRELIEMDKPSKNYWINGLTDYFSNLHTIIGTSFSFFNFKDIARTNYQLAIKLSPDYIVPKNFYGSLSGYNGDPRYVPGAQSSSSAQLLEQGRMLLKKNDLQNAYKTFQKATFIDPLNHEARTELAQLLKVGGYTEEAYVEYQNILKYFPDNQNAQEQIKVLGDLIDFDK
jgi:tetratricopeptide (TPR) repeat protein